MDYFHFTIFSLSYPLLVHFHFAGIFQLTCPRSLRCLWYVMTHCFYPVHVYHVSRRARGRRECYREPLNFPCSEPNQMITKPRLNEMTILYCILPLESAHLECCRFSSHSSSVCLVAKRMLVGGRGPIWWFSADWLIIRLSYSRSCLRFWADARSQVHWVIFFRIPCPFPGFRRCMTTYIHHPQICNMSMWMPQFYKPQREMFFSTSYYFAETQKSQNINRTGE